MVRTEEAQLVSTLRGTTRVPVETRQGPTAAAQGADPNSSSENDHSGQDLFPCFPLKTYRSLNVFPEDL